MHQHKSTSPSYYRLKRYYSIVRALMQGKVIGGIHELKQTIIDNYRRKYDVKTLVETGTYLGAMVRAQLPFFETVYSVELSEELFHKNKEQFKGNKNVHLLHGDSAVRLNDIVPALTAPALFWLDGHYSAGITARGELDTPIETELRTVLGVKKPDHIVLIDDARLFNGKDDYPTLHKLEQLVKQLKPDYRISVKYDVIRIVPANKR